MSGFGISYVIGLSLVPCPPHRMTAVVISLIPRCSFADYKSRQDPSSTSLLTPSCPIPRMRIAIVGTGYVGLCTGVGFALRGHTVTCVDRHEDKVSAISAGKSPIYETGLDAALRKALRAKKLKATTNLAAAMADADLVFIAVGTPSRPDGSIDLSAVQQACWDIGGQLKTATSPDAGEIPAGSGRQARP